MFQEGLHRERQSSRRGKWKGSPRSRAPRTIAPPRGHPRASPGGAHARRRSGHARMRDRSVCASTRKNGQPDRRGDRPSLRCRLKILSERGDGDRADAVCTFVRTPGRRRGPQRPRGRRRSRGGARFTIFGASARLPGSRRARPWLCRSPPTRAARAARRARGASSEASPWVAARSVRGDEGGGQRAGGDLSITCCVRARRPQSLHDRISRRARLP